MLVQSLGAHGQDPMGIGCTYSKGGVCWHLSLSALQPEMPLSPLFPWKLSSQQPTKPLGTKETDAVYYPDWGTAFLQLQGSWSPEPTGTLSWFCASSGWYLGSHVAQVSVFCSKSVIFDFSSTPGHARPLPRFTLENIFTVS